jgi:[ribosomal protein S5]-alanine N-acetyltransferase
MNAIFTTERLNLRLLAPSDQYFIIELLNSEGWLRFIGNRNIGTPEEARAYIQRILDNPATTYWIAELKADQTPVGIITLIKRDYLESHDIGFAFLPAFGGMGYAFEAANTVLKSLMESGHHTKILATTIPENTASIRLLKKMGLEFESEIVIQQETLHVYSRRRVVGNAGMLQSF